MFGEAYLVSLNKKNNQGHDIFFLSHLLQFKQ